MSPTAPGSLLVPVLRYRDAAAAVPFLEAAFGFVRRAVYADESGVVHHAELVFGEGPTRAMIMLGSARDDAFGQLQRPPSPGEPVTQSVYVVVPDADAHHARAVAAGAEVVYALRDESYGGRGYSCRDPGGHLWSFGTYDPWATPPA